MRNLLITGKPGTGKTTAVRRIADDFSDKNLVGLYTREIRDEGTRVGFEAVSTAGRRRVLAHTGIQSPCTVGRYGVDVEGFEAFLEEIPFTDPGADLIVIDEIGKMEWFSQRFQSIVQEALDSRTPCIASIALKAGGGIAAIRNRNDVALVEITRQNRDEMLPRLLAKVREMMSRTTGA